VLKGARLRPRQTEHEAAADSSPTGERGPKHGPVCCSMHALADLIHHQTSFLRQQVPAREDRVWTLCGLPLVLCVGRAAMACLAMASTGSVGLGAAGVGGLAFVPQHCLGLCRPGLGGE
jgi:hypothetical protein